MNQAPVQRITIIVAHTDGSQSTFYCEEPVLPELEMVTPLNPLPVRGGLEDLVPYAIAGPDLSRMKVEFKAHPRHGIITEFASQPLPDVIWAFRKATGWSLQQAVDYAAAILDHDTTPVVLLCDPCAIWERDAGSVVWIRTLAS